ncbi:ADP-ribosylglycohydrolase family protein [Laceyella putida]|uniref:ADP-ribosylglycohydrolase family protein n=1 Tax=Laceyella putida TaxID=110101 RepID=A0ABW2RQ17_9BACL
MAQSQLSMEDRILGGLWGLLIGDALGVPYEFKQAHELPPADQIDMQPPTDFSRTYPSIPPGTWSDDGAQALALLDSLLTCDQLDVNDFATRIIAWAERGEYAVDQNVFDIGVQTSEALRAIQHHGVPPAKAGFIRSEGKGNGSLMRVLPLALWHLGTDEALVHDAHLQSVVTHGHETNQACCALYCLWARRLIQGLPWEEAYADALRVLRDIYKNQPTHEQALEWEIRPDSEPFSDGSGYVVASLHAARLSLKNDTYVGAVKAAIQLGQDTDTNAAIVGGLAGLRDGIQAIPTHWRTQLRGHEIVNPLAKKLLEHRKPD